MEKFSDLLPLLQGAPAAAPAAGADGSLVSTLVMMGAIILIFYFLIIRPQNKKQKDTEKMLTSLKKGDKVRTIGGLRAVVEHVKDDTIVVRADENTTLEFDKSAVAGLVVPPAPKEEAKKEDKKADKKDSK